MNFGSTDTLEKIKQIENQDKELEIIKEELRSYKKGTLNSIFSGEFPLLKADNKKQAKNQTIEFF